MINKIQKGNYPRVQQNGTVQKGEGMDRKIFTVF